MPKFGRSSRKNLSTAHPDLQKLFNEVIKEFDCSVICGHRGHADQDKAFAKGKSKLQWPKSKHNKVPSLAVDAAPFPIDWSNQKRFYELAEVVKATAKRLGIRIVCGIEWKKFVDPPHYELG